LPIVNLPTLPAGRQASRQVESFPNYNYVSPERRKRKESWKSFRLILQHKTLNNKEENYEIQNSYDN
jgi:hypothetical protein